MSSLSSRQFTAKLLSEVCDWSSRSIRRITINADILKTSKIFAGDVIALSDANSSTIGNVFAVGVAWPSLGISQDSILVSSSLLLTARIVEGTTTRLFPLSGAAIAKLPPGLPSIQEAHEAVTICVKEISENTNAYFDGVINDRGKRPDWLSLSLKELLVHLKYVTSTQTVEVLYEGQTRRFTLASVSAERSDSDGRTDVVKDFHALSITNPSQVWVVSWDTSVNIVTNNEVSSFHEPEKEMLIPNSKVNGYSSVGGLDNQIAQIRDLIEIPLTRPDLFRHFGLKPPRGILLHGAPGTGKTHLARAIASSTKSSVLVVNGPELSSAYHGETESKLRDVFTEARQKSPCIVVLDEVDALVPRREDGAGGEVEKRVVATLLTLLDGMEGEGDNGGRVVVIGTTNRPNAIDPALRRPGRFDREIEIGIPDADARFSILDVLLSNTPHSISNDDLRSVAARAYGYVGADLSAVVREAGTTSIKRWLANHPFSAPVHATDLNPLILTLDDLITSLPSVRPSAMRSLLFESPPIRYSEIGGQASVIQKLRETVEWPLLHPEAFKRLGVRPPKGVLLYGPPGCSKTILVRACACESGVNFVAVKGPELLNKFLGESERAVREIFRKARAASPSIIFFDEIDALGTSRTSADSDTGAGSHGGVLTSLLNEMDGVQELLGVTVVAATNRPDVLDSALMRPGRLDRILYVGPPDQKGREEILRIRMSKMAVDPSINVEEIARMTEGCSGAEISALCQEAALLVMQRDINAPYVSSDAFTIAAKAAKRQITPNIIQKFQQWAEGNGLRNI